MSDLQGQSEEERRLMEAIALAQSIVEENSRNAQKTDTDQNRTHDDGANRQKKSHGESDGEAGAGAGKKTGIVWKVIFGVSVIAVIVCGFLVIRYIRGHNRSLRAENELRTYVDRNTEAKTEHADTTETAATAWYPDLKVDFQGLISQNKDICAWIYIPGTDVDYPVLQGTDNSYYLTHDAYGEYSPDGSIFVDAGCSRKFDDFDTIIYGHNMSTGTMFKTLHNYEDDEFWKENRNVYVYLPDRVLRYEVFAAYRTNDRHILTYNDFSDKEVRENYLNNIKEKNFDEGIVKFDQNIDIYSLILTLSTCCGMDGKRWLVQSVKIDEVHVGAQENK